MSETNEFLLRLRALSGDPAFGERVFECLSPEQRAAALAAEERRAQSLLEDAWRGWMELEIERRFGATHELLETVGERAERQELLLLEEIDCLPARLPAAHFAPEVAPTRVVIEARGSANIETLGDVRTERCSPTRLSLRIRVDAAHLGGIDVGRAGMMVLMAQALRSRVAFAPEVTRIGGQVELAAEFTFPASRRPGRALPVAIFDAVYLFANPLPAGIAEGDE